MRILSHVVAYNLQSDRRVVQSIPPSSGLAASVWVDGADCSHQLGAPCRPYIYRPCIACQTTSALAADWQALERHSSHCRGDATFRRVRGQDAVPWRSLSPGPSSRLLCKHRAPASWRCNGPLAWATPMTYLGPEPITAPTPGARHHRLHVGISGSCRCSLVSRHVQPSSLHWWANVASQQRG